ncbi:hypothetical protein OJAV_G00186170 [Oryzias javanicus]|uniref:TATA box-binding protein-like 1 n=1 Tax=Oryzias javanicus TaxID=123683 RepID=A0A437C9F3_ORYJA|nr:hypothetical protein OJAV_G00186170 [Oryzias javanicus]
MAEVNFGALYPMDEDAVQHFYHLFVESVAPQVKEEEEEEEEGQPEGQPEAVKPNEGGCGPAHPLAPEEELRPAGVSRDLNDGGTSRLTADGADDLPPLTIRNVVSVMDLGSKLDLPLINRTLWNTECKNRGPRQLIMRIRRPRTTAIMFRSGKMICFGATSVEQARQAARRHARILQKAGFPVRFLSFRIFNCVCTVKTFPVRLEGLVRSDPVHFRFEPELSRSAQYMTSSSMTATVHRRGSIIIMGSPSLDGCQQLLKTLYPMLKLFRQI